MRILGVDCGSERTGYGVIESDGRRHYLLVCGVVRTKPSEPLSDRLRIIAGVLRGVIAEYQPEQAAVEDLFHAHNARTVIKLAHVRGVALMILAEAALTIGEYSPMAVKNSVVGYGRAEKQQVQLMVQSLLSGHEAIESEDAADAVAVAICHATRSPAAAMVRGAAQ